MARRCDGLGAVTEVQGDPGNPGKSLTFPSGDTFPRKRSWRRRLELVSLQLSKTADHDVWLASVRCWTLHTKLAQELDADRKGRNSASIEMLGAQRCRALSDLAKIQSRGLDGIFLKKNILILVHGSYDEAMKLLRSCLSDCDRVIGTQDSVNLIDAEPDLAVAVAHFFQTTNQLECESDRYDEFDEEGREAELAELFSTIQNLAVQIEATIEAVANHRAATLAGLKAKFKVFEMCEECHGDGRALLSLQNSMFRDFDRLLQQHVKKPAPPTPKKIPSLV